MFTMSNSINGKSVHVRVSKTLRRYIEEHRQYDKEPISDILERMVGLR